MLWFIVFLLAGHSFAEEFDQISASRQEIAQAPCLNSYSLKSDIFASYLRKVESQATEKISTGVGGIYFQSAPASLVSSYRQLSSHLNYKLSPVMDIDYWEAFKDENCADPVCAAKLIFGSERGELYLTIQNLTGVSLSHLGYERLKPPIFPGESAPSERNEALFEAMYHPVPWELPELSIYLNGLLNLPESLFPLPVHTRMLYNRFPHWEGEQVHANAAITLYPSLLARDSHYKMYTLVHEVGHIVAAARGINQDTDWVQISWEIMENQVRARKDAHFISTYASQDYFEDFAESFAAYRFVPARLKAQAPKKYQYLKDRVFAGEEYLGSCPVAIGDTL